MKPLMWNHRLHKQKVTKERKGGFHYPPFLLSWFHNLVHGYMKKEVAKCWTIWIMLLLMLTCSCQSIYRSGETASSPLASPILPVWSIPTPSSPDVGIVTGRLLSEDSSWASFYPLYLGEIVSFDGNPVMVSLDKSRAPRSQLDSSGRFVFSDVPEGRYCLILDLVTRTIVLRNPSTGDDLIIEVEGGKVIDIGELHYHELPLPD